MAYLVHISGKRPSHTLDPPYVPETLLTLFSLPPYAFSSGIQATLRIAPALYHTINTFCTHCSISDRVGTNYKIATRLCNSTKSPPTKQYGLSVVATATINANRPFCNLLGEFQRTLHRNTRNSQLLLPDIGLFNLYNVCIYPEGLGTAVCLQQNSSATLSSERGLWRVTTPQANIPSPCPDLP